MLSWLAGVIVGAGALNAQTPNDAVSPLPSPSIPAGPRPTATISQVTASPQPTVVVTPLPNASPSGTQPRTTNTVAPSPTATPTP